MRAVIREISIPVETLRENGLPPQATTLRGLGPTVMLAGPNGAGKSRFLRSVSQTVREASDWSTTQRVFHDLLPSYRATLTDPAATQESIQSARSLVRTYEAFSGIKVEGHRGLVALEGGLAQIDLTYDLRKRIIDADDQTTLKLREGVEATAQAGFASAYLNAHGYVTAVAKHLFNSRHADLATNADLQLQKQDAEQFNTIVHALLGAPVDWMTSSETGDVVPLMMGRPFQEVELSSGQKILLAWAIILHRQRAHLRNAIVTIDEPENHLHPDVCIAALDRLRRDVLGDRGQIWLATHSVPLIAWAGFSSIHFVQDGRVEYAGNRVNEVVNGLVGGEEGRDRLRGFLADAESLAVLKFAAESLSAPAVAHTKGGDPQEAGFATLVAARAAAGQLLRVLDYGAGNGRLAAALAEARRPSQNSAALSPLRYFAHDREGCAPACRAHLADLNELAEVEATYVDDLRELHGAAEKVDVVVLCNVLHEIPVSNWLKTFREVAAVLADDGCLVVMEDQTPSVGELPNQGGFVILDEIETRRLFGDDPRVRSAHADAQGLGHRLTTIEVPRAALAKATAQTIVLALLNVQERAEHRITALREDADSASAFRNGRLHALYAMLWVNAKLAAQTFGAAPT